MKQTIVFLLLVLLVRCTQQSFVDRFIFYGYIECRYRRHWCYQVDAWEFDALDPDDHLGVYRRCTGYPKAGYQISGSQGNGDGFGLFYRLGLKIRHTCTKDGLPTLVKSETWWRNIGYDKPYYLEKNFTFPEERFWIWDWHQDGGLPQQG